MPVLQNQSFLSEGINLQTLLTSTPVPQKKLKAITVRSFVPKIDFRRLLNRIPFGSREAKATVVLVFTLCWLLILVVRSHAPRDPATLEGSSLMGLATSLQQGAISGRDFQSTYGPAAQFLAWMATRATATQSALDAYGMINFFFGAASAILIAAMLIICNRISWQQSVIFYLFSAFLNLFFNVLDFRTALLLLSAAFAYRTIAAETVPRQTVWATATGLLCFVSQLVTFELGICTALAVLCALAAGSALTRQPVVLLGAEVFVATLAAANLGLVAFFKLTSSNYELLFDYQNYGLEILRGYHNSMGMLWGLPFAQTVVLAIVALYVVGVCAVSAWKSDPLEASLFASLGFAAMVWLKTALVRSDVAQIAFAFTPFIVILSLLATREWNSPRRRLAWATVACGLLFVWPSLNLSAPADLVKIVRGQVPAKATIRELYTARKPLEADLQASLVTPDLADRRNVSVLAFPYDNYIGVGLHRPFFAPVLESYSASTESLERYYIRALDERRQAGLEIVYGPDRTSVPPVGGLQAVSQTPLIFDYLYRHFEVVSNKEHADGHYILRPRLQPRDVAIEPLAFSIPQQVANSGIVKLRDPSACGLVFLRVRIEYAKNPQIFRPSGIELSLSNNDQLVWQGSIRPLELNKSFVTLVSPLPPAIFHKVFGNGPIQSVKWDKLAYHASASDLLGSTANRISVETLACVDPQKFVENTTP